MEKELFLERIRPAFFNISRGSSIDEVLRSLQKGEIVLANENSLIDTNRIDHFNDGRVRPQAYDPLTAEGNSKVREYIERMIALKENHFFPGTFLRNYGSITLPVTIAILNGQVTKIRPKKTSPAYVDDYEEAAKEFMPDEYARGVKFNGACFLEPMASLNSIINDRTTALSGQDCLVNIEGLNVLPIICNELEGSLESDAPEGIDVVLHSADSMFGSYDELVNRISNYFEELAKRRKLNLPAIYAISHEGDFRFNGKFVYSEQGLKRKI
jgi:hypothetical protein